MKLLNCTCGAAALHIAIKHRDQKIGNTRFTFLTEHRVECSKKCGKSVSAYSTATETKKWWNKIVQYPEAKP